MFASKKNRVWLVGALLVAVVGGVCLADVVVKVTVNINPYKIVLNAQGQSDDVQANIPISLATGWDEGFTAKLYIEEVEVAQAVSARYCYDDDILIIDFDRTTLQNNPTVQANANQTVTATVTATVTKNGELITIEGSDQVEIVKPGKKGK